MALSGLRDLSVLEEAPVGRYPVQTYVMEHNAEIVADAIRRELARGGQVYYLHNRVESIHQTAARIAKRIPEARIAVGHGQMGEEELEDVLQRVIDGDVDVFVCTTIIEAGVDIPNVNTLIIEDAERFGLAQLHQIRGRVGRSTRRAYAYFTYRPGRQLTEIAEKRLSAIRDFAEFGAGMKIAMRDLEIRGAGNLLGSEQSGHLISVGYDMYLKLLEEAVLEERGEKAPVKTECAADLSVSAFIPEKLVASSGERMDLYRRIAFVREPADAEDMTDEIIDRYGDCPRPVQNLIAIALLRADASAAGISEIRQVDACVNFALSGKDLRPVSALISNPEFKGRLLLNAGEKPYIALRLRKGEDLLERCRHFIDAYLAAAAG
jgi:transcription-repair coupling factor (superfamily II helicase)